MANILIIDDDQKICLFLSDLLDGSGHKAITANTIADGLKLTLSTNIDLVLLDLDLPDGKGLHVMPDLLRAPSNPEVIIITGTGDVNAAKLAFTYGAWDYVQKPFTMEEVFLPITRALEYRKEKKTTKAPLTLDREGIIGSSEATRSCLDDVARASIIDASILITGETGTGKELFALAIHRNCKRSSGNFIPVDCGAIPETLAEGIFFGHEKGAFTGADIKREGMIRQADGGTLFLDEIGDLPRNIQKSLLRVLQEKCIRPLGGAREITVDFRLVAATNRNLDKMVEEKRFRKDLLYRVRGIEIKLPPLRERGKDLQEIAISKIHEISQHYGIEAKGISNEFLELLSTHIWPGNVRELINVLEFALASIGEDPTLHPKHLPPEYRAVILNRNTEQFLEATGITDTITETDGEFPTLFECRGRAEKDYLKMLIKKARGNREKARRLSGISQARLYGLMKKHKLSLFKPS